MTNAEKLSLAHQKQAAGDARPLEEINAEEAALFATPHGAGDVLARRHLVNAQGETIEHVEVLADGSDRRVGA